MRAPPRDTPHTHRPPTSLYTSKSNKNKNSIDFFTLKKTKKQFTYLHTLHQLPEYRMPAVEMWGGSEGNKELTTVRVGASVCHGEHPSALVRSVANRYNGSPHQKKHCMQLLRGSYQLNSKDYYHESTGPYKMNIF